MNALFFFSSCFYNFTAIYLYIELPRKFVLQCENDGEVEYEFPCYNLVERIDGLWDMTDTRYTDGAYGGVRLKTEEGTTHLLHAIFPRLQVGARFK